MSSPAPAERSIFSRRIDFLALGGASLAIIPALALLPASMEGAAMTLTTIIAVFINWPHFAASYVIFYRDFSTKLFGTQLSDSMRIRYWIAGVLTPAAMFGFFSYCLIAGAPALMGQAANAMLFLVGWHYTKQGYGILIVDSVNKRRFFSAAEKNVFRYNAYACWIFYWLFANWYVSEREMMGLHYYSFHVPLALLSLSAAAAVISTLRSLKICFMRLLPGGEGLPVTGVIIYFTTLYLWLAGRFVPIAALLVPAFHSLQYLVIVGRVEINRSVALSDGRQQRAYLIKFALISVLLGVVGFFSAPVMLDSTFADIQPVFGGAAFMFIFAIFINIHHYFMDNVIWRADNSETAKYLFSQL